MIYIQENVTLTAISLCVNLKLYIHTYIHTGGGRQTDRRISHHTGFCTTKEAANGEETAYLGRKHLQATHPVRVISKILKKTMWSKIGTGAQACGRL